MFGSSASIFSVSKPVVYTFTIRQLPPYSSTR